MITLGNRRIFMGGFHDHWISTNADNPALLMAAMKYYPYDFICLMDGEGGTSHSARHRCLLFRAGAL